MGMKIGKIGRKLRKGRREIRKIGRKEMGKGKVN